MVTIALSRQHPACLHDSPSYQPRDSNTATSGTNATLWLPRTAAAALTYYQIVVHELYEYGLVLPTLTVGHRSSIVSGLSRSLPRTRRLPSREQKRTRRARVVNSETHQITPFFACDPRGAGSFVLCSSLSDKER